jgi:hypothetical protein
MTIAHRAQMEYRLISIKRKIEDLVMAAAKDGKRFIETPDLFCHPEEIPTLLEWMKKEGLQAKKMTWMAKPTSWGSFDDDVEVEHTKWTISF